MPLSIRTGALALAVLLAPGVAAAQDHHATLQDGRTIIVATTTATCGTPALQSEPRFALALIFSCTDSATGHYGEGAFLVAAEPRADAPRDYLMERAREFWPDETDEARAGQIQAGQLTAMSGAVQPVICLGVENEDRTFGQLTCVIDQPRAQVVASIEARTLEEATTAMGLFFGGVEIR